MHRKLLRPATLLLGLAAVAIGTTAAAGEFPGFADVEGVVHKELAARPGYQSGDVLARSEVHNILTQIGKLGWNVKEGPQIEALVLEDSHFLIRQLRTKRGTRFMRKIAKMPDGYSRLEHLYKLSGGKQIVHDLIRGKGGWEMINYLSKSRGGKNMGRQLTHGPGGRDFNKPTGRIYTAEELTKALQEAYVRQVRENEKLAKEKQRPRRRGQQNDRNPAQDRP